MNALLMQQNQTLKMKYDDVLEENYLLRLKLDKVRNQCLEAQAALEKMCTEEHSHREQLKAWGVQK